MRTPAPARVLLVADDPTARDSLTLALGDSVVGVARGTLDWELHAGNDDGYDVVVWDDATTGDVVAPNTVVPLLALVDGPDRARAWLAGGARGALQRDGTGGRVTAALLAMEAGLVVVDEAFGPALSESARTAPAQAQLFTLTGREHEVLGLLAEGHSNREIARTLGISSHTAKFHVNTLLEKLDADTRTEAVVRAVRAGVLSI